MSRLHTLFKNPSPSPAARRSWAEAAREQLETHLAPTSGVYSPEKIDEDTTVLLSLSAPIEPLRVAAMQEFARRVCLRQITLEAAWDYFKNPVIFLKHDAESLKDGFKYKEGKARRFFREALLFGLKQALEEPSADTLRMQTKCFLQDALSNSPNDRSPTQKSWEGYCIEDIAGLLVDYAATMRILVKRSQTNPPTEASLALTPACDTLWILFAYS